MQTNLFSDFADFSGVSSVDFADRWAVPIHVARIVPIVPWGGDSAMARAILANDPFQLGATLHLSWRAD